MKLQFAAASICALIVAASGCGEASQISSNRAQMNHQNGNVHLVGARTMIMPNENPSQSGLSFRLSETAPEAEPIEAPSLAETVKLDEQRIAALIGRLPLLESADNDKQTFKLPEGPIPPPRTGTKVETPFPPADDAVRPDTPAGAPPEVLRFGPEGDVPLAPNLSVTFSQPMVPLTTHDALAAGDVPVKLDPLPPGDWRWVGTRTLLFDPDGRFPMATRYTARVEAGTAAADGGRLPAAVEWKFITPPPTLVGMHPHGGPAVHQPLVFVGFDQRIDRQAVLAHIELRPGGAAPVPLRSATPEEIEEDPIVSRLAEDANPDTWLAFRPEQRLPGDATVSVVVRAGTPSAEGPLTTDTDQQFGFRTYGPLAVIDQSCAAGSECPPSSPWWVQFNNPLDPATTEAGIVRVEPELPGLKVAVHGNHLSIFGRSQGRTKYTVTLSAKLRDTFGQELGNEQAVDFHVGSAPSNLWAPGGHFVVLEPGQPRYSVYTTNQDRLDVRIYAVTPDDWHPFLEYIQRAWRNERGTKPVGRLVHRDTIDLNGEPDTLVETPIDLTPALTGGTGQLLVVVEPARQDPQRPLSSRAWVQVTPIGLDAAYDSQRLIGWATSLADGKPLEGVRLAITPGGSEVDTGADGLATLALPKSAGRSSRLLVARTDNDLAILPEQQSPWQSGASGWYRHTPSDTLRWHVFDDRGMYRPGESVHLKGWIRTISPGPLGDVGPAPEGLKQVSYKLVGPQNNELSQGEIAVGPLGAFDIELALPADMNLGNARLQLTAPGAGGVHHHGFQVQEFRRPEFEVSATASSGPHFVGEHAVATVAAGYYAGGALPNAEVQWTVSTMPGHFTPPGRDDFTFGTWEPWWGWQGWWGGEQPAYQRETFFGRTDAQGQHHLRIDFTGVDPPRPASVTASAAVTDVNRQQWSAGANMLVHPAAHYVGLRSARMFVREGEPLVIEAIVTDLDGKLLAGREISFRAARIDWVYRDGQYREEEVDPQEQVLQSADEPIRVEFKTTDGGRYRVKATIADDQGRPNGSELTLWVAGGNAPPSRDVEQQQVTLIPDKQEYQAGDTAELLIQAPFAPAEALVTLRRDGIVRSERFTLDEPSHTLRVPIEEAYTPNIHVQVDLVGAAPRTDDAGRVDDTLPKRPAFAAGSISLPVPPRRRELNVAVVPEVRELEPGGETTIATALTDADGQPVANAQLAVVVVDEAILALSGYQLADPLATFYSQRGSGTGDLHLRANVILARPDELPRVEEEQGQLPAAASDELRMEANFGLDSRRYMLAEKTAGFFADSAGGVAPPPLSVRTDFRALALFVPSVMTDANGEASVPITLPDSLTRYRVMVVAVAGATQYGKGESTITARLPLMLRPSPPRFLNYGDRFELPVALQNQTDAPLNVDVVVRAANARITDGSGRRVTVPAHDRVEVRFPAAAEMPGTARFQVGAVTETFADAAEVHLPVWTPATSEAFATYGQIDTGDAVQPVAVPDDVVPQFGGLEITTTSTALASLTDAVLYLTSYPFECAEQISSRVLAIAALKDVLGAFEADGLPPPEALMAAVKRDLERLERLQNDDGGYGFWRRGERSWPYLSIHAAHAMARARAKDFAVPQQMLDRSLTYLQQIERHIPPEYSIECRRALIAYALYVRRALGDDTGVEAETLLVEAGTDKLPLEALGWLLTALGDDERYAQARSRIVRHLENRATETAATAHFATSYTDGAHLLLHSDRRADGVILEALIGADRDNDLIPKVVAGLMAHRTKGRWSNTQENAFILLALDRYFAEYEAETPDFVARVWLGQQFAGEHAFRGRTTEQHHVSIPMQLLTAGEATRDPLDLLVAKDGGGRLYYRLGLRYAPASLKLAPTDHGFTVERRYEPVDDPEHVYRDPDGVWHVTAGQKVRVRVTMVAPTRRYHVALVDRLPAGLEPLNPVLAVTGPIDPDPNERPSGYWWWRRWFEHQNLRDDRAEAFTSLLWEGVHEYSYVARATTPGTYVVPPPKVEEMYHPETFGRGSSDTLVVQ